MFLSITGPLFVATCATPAVFTGDCIRIQPGFQLFSAAAKMPHYSLVAAVVNLVPPLTRHTVPGLLLPLYRSRQR